MVTLHEYGHYYVAKKYSVKCAEFSIGIAGSVLYSFNLSDGTPVNIKPLLIGAYVMLNKDDLMALSNKDRAIIYGAGVAYSLAGVVLCMFWYLIFYSSKDDPFLKRHISILSIVVILFLLWIFAPAVFSFGSVYLLVGIGLLYFLIALGTKGTKDEQVDTSSEENALSIIGILRDGSKVVKPSQIVELLITIGLGFAILNLLPFPPLDGGHIFVLGLEELGVNDFILSNYSIVSSFCVLAFIFYILLGDIFGK